ncbi:MAG TPA: sigma 54-interacting transcriptional regulator [Candidatus Kryptonia bacterium]|nr:sigma 54-interacting transcriptional regulator [Candidatus Kryptonia bacterium]
MSDPHPTDAILGEAALIEALRAQIRRLASFDTPGSAHVPTVLLQGETGTGKGLVARVIHDSGPRAGGPFVDVNCAAIPEPMLEAELFGFEAGAFTDAKRAKPGLFEAASGGTLFLDEVDSLSAPVQSKVLKAIEEKRVRRLGAVAARDVDVKLIAATQRDLKTLVESGGFRADLYHRLAVLVIAIPPLRERADDVVRLAEHFLRWYADAHRLTPKRLSESGKVCLLTYAWPGNVRELGHVMERMTLLHANDEVDAAALQELGGAVVPSLPAPATAAADADESSEEARQVRLALTRAGGNVARAARALGIGRNALRYRMRRLGITRADDNESPAPPPESPARATTPGIAAPLQPAWEQKPVAMLVISLAFRDAPDARGYDPWTEATRWNRAMAERIEGFGGVLHQRSPSRLTAVFGVPRALEQTPQRAVQAAVAIQRAVAQAGARAPDLRAAIHVGEVRLNAAAADSVAQLFPIGDTFALAERLLGHAGTGEVLISPQAARRVERTCDLFPRQLQLGPADADRLTAHTVVRLRSPALPESAAVEDAPTRFVGRDREVDLLRDTFERAATGHGQVVFIAGDAGIGKSRLLAQFRMRLAARPHRWVEGRCASYGTTTPFLPITDAMRRYLDIDDQDDDASATAKITREVDRLGGDLTWTLPFVQQALSLRIGDDRVRALDSASLRSEMFRAFRELMLRAADLDPIVFVVEDLHWIDPASEEFLAFVADTIPTTRVLLVLSHRSGYRHPFGDRSYHVRIALSPLSGGDVATMTSAILGTPEIPASLRSLIAEKAEGNPFFVEELAKSLLEEGALRRENGRVILTRDLGNIAVPDTVQDVLIARIDRLAEESRRAIQVASVIGREFALRLLARISEVGDRIHTQVEELRGLELIYEKALHPELAYMFKHALTHDVAYESVLRDRRTTLHTTIGLAIEELYADRLAEHYETLALHFSRGEEWQRALRYHELSAEKATATHANRAVADHCRQALAIADRLGDAVPAETRRRLNERLGRACFYLSEYAASGDAYEEAAARSVDPETHTLHLAAAGFSHVWAHRYESSRRCIDAALAFSRDHGVAAGEAMALAVHGFYRGVHDAEVGDCERNLQAALDICARHSHETVEAFARFQLVMVAEWTGSYADAVNRGTRALALGRQLRLPEIIVFSTWFLGKARCCLGEYGAAIAMLEEAFDVCDRIGDRAWKSRLLNTLGWCFAEIGDIERACSYNERAAALARDIGDPEILSNADINLSANHLVLGHVDRALGYLEPIEDALSRPGDPWMRWRYQLHALHIRGEIELARNQPQLALARADGELNGARQHRAPKLAARALALRGAALLALDRRDEVEVPLREALAIAERIGHRRAVVDAHLLFAETERRSGNTSAAAAHAAQARAVGEQLAGSLANDDLRRHLRRSVSGELSA